MLLALREKARATLELSFGLFFVAQLRLQRAVQNIAGSSVYLKNQHILIAPPGSGSVGDQAMVDAFSNSTDGHVIGVVRDSTVLLRTPHSKTGPISTVVMPNLLYGSWVHHLRDLKSLLELANNSASLSVIGADVMDGVYSRYASKRRFNIAYLAALLGIKTKILGFSWNSSPDEGAIAAMRRCSRNTELLARDPVTYDRLYKDGARSAHQAADLAFLTKPQRMEEDSQVYQWIKNERTLGRTIAIINLNSALSTKIDQVDMFARLVKDRIPTGISFIFLPHDSRGPGSDEDLAAALYDACNGGDHTHLVESISLPGIVTAIAKEADFVVTGRMHLAILSATVNTPSLALTYQGKVEGLYQLLGINSWVEPSGLLYSELLENFDSINQNAPIFRQNILDNMSRITELAGRNIAS